MNASTKHPKKQIHCSFSFYVTLENQNLSQTYILLNFPFMTLVIYYSSTYSAPVNTGQRNIPQTQNRLLLWQFLDSLYLGCSFSAYQVYIWLMPSLFQLFS